MADVGAMMVGGNSEKGRQKNDNYPTPPEVTTALIRSSWGPSRGSGVWEPACGELDMALVLCLGGWMCETSDPYSGKGIYKRSFFDFDVPLAPQIVTNPPFSLAAQWIEHSYKLRVDYLALLLKMTFWSAERRHGLFKLCQPVAVLPLTWRPDFLNLGAPAMDCAWYVWRPTSQRPLRHTAFEPLPRPR